MRAAPRRALSGLAGAVAAAAVLRLALLAWNAAARPELFDPGPERLAEVAAGIAGPGGPFVSAAGFELANVAYALVCAGEGYASPFGGGTGPTGWAAPGMVAPYAAAFALFGCFSGGAVLALLALALAASAALVLLAHEAARSLFGPGRAPLAAAWLMALSPWDLRIFRAGSLHDLNLPGLALAALAVLLLRVRERPSGGRLAACAAGAALAALVNPVLAGVAAAGLGLLVLRRRVPAGRAAAAFLAAQLALVGPWVAWQRGNLGAWVYVKSNLPFELWLGNLPGVDGLYTREALRRHHPSQSAEEFRDYRRLGERDYVAGRGRAFLRELEAGRLVRATARRAALFFFWYPEQAWEASWTLPVRRALAVVPGLVLLAYPFVRGRGRPRLGEGEALVYLLVAAYAAPFLVTGMMERYLVPVTPLVLVLAAGALPRRREGVRPAGA